MAFFIYSATLVAWYEWSSKQLEVSDVLLFDAEILQKKKLKALGVRPGIPSYSTNRND